METVCTTQSQTSEKPRIDFESHLRPFPAAAAQLMQACKDPACNAKKVTTIIECDPGLTARIMKLSNSSLYGCSGKIKSINHAVVLLGMRSVRDMAISMAGAELFTQKGICQDIQNELWKHSLASACISRSLCSMGTEINASDAFLAGLFHDVGKIIFLDMVPNEYAPIFVDYVNGEDLGSDAQREQLELNEFGVSHTQVGLECANQWGLPAETTEAIAYHHCPEEAPNHSDIAKLAQKSSDLAWEWVIDEPCDEDFEIDEDDPDSAVWVQIRKQATTDFEEILKSL